MSNEAFNDDLADHFNMAAINIAADLAPKCESPIETMFGIAAIMAVRLFFHRPIFLLAPDLYVPEPKRYPEYYYIKPQQQIGRHRVDFVVGISTIMPEAIVECDGREFHHSTREQIERDRERDRELEAAGYKVFRFPGTQIHKQAMHCAEDVLGWLQDQEPGE